MSYHNLSIYIYTYTFMHTYIHTHTQIRSMQFENLDPFSKELVKRVSTISLNLFPISQKAGSFECYELHKILNFVRRQPHTLTYKSMISTLTPNMWMSVVSLPSLSPYRMYVHLHVSHIFSELLRRPCVLFGSQTCRNILINAQSVGTSNIDPVIQNYESSNMPLHMVSIWSS